ncbi:SMP-30/gluconolactonase/LRE family protein [Hoyosella rhizosphaerae]|uniref:Strictosidine synthase n=1 Tax=Hoyosella rhizosphaerae TaxID=1755582 RepID=A0A916U240_9ACTN|nr:SMP-30/gluconolactonase/LRE family protein [Hoyosella rhizosphaerae]MBN4926684.1 SMP-30/gluconolactonase/LRE family protein [Hoyosella rhizosphaerae]GGC57251.1 strictosidine synthase [Hoyosella rhizosphaerae]
MSTTFLAVHPVPGEGPEDVVIAADGSVFAGLVDGQIIRRSPDGEFSTIAELPGRPLGIELFGDGELVVCASDAGLLAVDIATGNVRTLVSEVAGIPLRTCNNAAVASDGSIYFSDSSTEFVIPQWRAEMIAQTGTGRLLKRSPDGAVDVIAEGLQFANGVALAPDESFVVVAESSTRQIQRVWLTGPKTGTAEVWIDDLPGYPDNCSTGTDGLIWVALANPTNRALSLVQYLPNAARRLVSKVPEKVLPKPKSGVGFLGINADGTVAHEEYGRVEGFELLTSVRERNGDLWFGSLSSSAIAHMHL